MLFLTQDVVIRRLGGEEKYIKECMENCIVNLGKKMPLPVIYTQMRSALTGANSIN